MDLRTRGAWVAAVAAAAGTALTLSVLVRGGGYGVVVPRLTWYLPLAVIGVIALLAARGFGGERVTPVVWLGTVVMAAIAWNYLVFLFRMGFAAFSEVLMSLSMLIELKLPSTASVSMRRNCARGTLRSVTRKTRSVARLGSIIPAPLAMPTIDPPPTSARRILG